MTSLASHAQTAQRVSHPFITGQVYREQRPEAVEKIHGRIRQAYRGANKQCIRLPKRIYLRVLAIMTNSVVVISTEDPNPRECFYNLEQGANFVATGAWLLTEIEPLAIMRIPDHQLSKNQTAVMDKNTALIQPLIDIDEDALIPQIRWPVIGAIASKRQIKPAYVLRVFGRYLQGGMSPQALAGRWFRRLSRIGLGARVNMASEKSVRRHPAGRPRLDGKNAFIVQEIDVKKIIAGARKHYFAGDTCGVWLRAWKLTVARDYLDLDCENGIPSNEQLARFSPGDYPSYKQFRYWAQFDEDYEMLLRKLYGERKFQLTKRRRTKTTESNANGPGVVYITDATPLGWYLVHQNTRLPLEKKAVLYLVADAYSHLIVGFFLYLGDESYDPLSVALLSTAEDKVELCARYGIAIDADEWPAKCLPTRLSEDGVGANYRHGALVKKRVIRGLTIVPPWRPDLKGLIESYNAVARRLAQSVPGNANGPKERGEESPVALACLDYHESCRLIISWILQLNRRIDRDYQLTPEMLADGVVPCPRDLWNWGCKNASGKRKTWPLESLMKWCLPTAKARITRDGVEFGEMLYEPIPGTLPKFESWCAQAAENGSRSVDVIYHPARYSEFYIYDGDSLIKMQLAPRSLLYATWSAAELASYKVSTAVSNKVREGEEEVRDIARQQEQQQIIEGGMAKTEKARGSVAARRRDKSDRKGSLEDQKRLIAAEGLSPADGKTQTPTPSNLQAEDEDDIVAMMKGEK